MNARTFGELTLAVVAVLSATAFPGQLPAPTTDVPLPGRKMQLSDTSGPAGRRNYVALRDGDQSIPLPNPRVTGATASSGVSAPAR